MPNLRDSDIFDRDALSGLQAVVRLVDAAREEERRKLARELHDTVLQPLASLTMSLQCFERRPGTAKELDRHICAWKQQAHEALDSLRATLTGISWRLSEAADLPELLQRQLQPELLQRGIGLTVETHDWPRDFSVEWVSQLYLVVREALTNVVKHACASAVHVILHSDPAYLAIFVEDDGSGLRRDDEVLPSAHATVNGLGIESMQARVRALGGSLVIGAAPTGGTRVSVYLSNSAPLRRQRAASETH